MVSFDSSVENLRYVLTTVKTKFEQNDLAMQDCYTQLLACMEKLEEIESHIDKMRATNELLK